MRPLRLVGLLSALVGCQAEPTEYARAITIESLDQAIGGPKALARPGDLLLENDKVRVAILAAERDGQTRFSMGPGLYAGSIVDADLQWNDPRFTSGRGLDQFAEFFPTASMNVPYPKVAQDVQIVADGSDGGAAIVRVRGEGAPFLEMLNALWAIVSQPEMYLITDYIAEPGKPWIEATTTVYFGWDGVGDPPAGTPANPQDTELPVIQWALQDGVILGDFYLSGGSVDVFGPGMGFDEDGAVFAAREQGQNLFNEPFRFDFIGGVADGVSYGLAPSAGAAFVPLFTSSQTAIVGAGQVGDGSARRFPDGTGLSYTRYFYVGHGDIGSIVDSYVQSRGIAHGHVRGTVLEESTLLPLSGIDVLVFQPGADAPWSQWRTDVDPRDDQPDGSFAGDLPVGTWELLVHREGRPDSERVTIEVTEGSEQALSLQSPRPGLVTFNIRDEVGRLVPSKVSIFPVTEESGQNPVFGDMFIAGGPERVLWPMYGTVDVELPDGRYRAVASRGIEYELDISEPFDVTATQRHVIDLEVVRGIDTEGWISADLHVHGQPSQDSGISRIDRIRTMASEGVEFFASTDHDYLTDYSPLIEDLELGEWVRAAVGNETSTVELGHYLGFPMAEDFTGDAGGAFDWTGMAPEEIIEGLRRAGEDAGFDPLVFVAHPRAGILGYFDQFGFDPYAGTPGRAGAAGEPRIDTPTLGFTNPLLNRSLFSLEMDAIEVMGTKELFTVRTPTQPELDAFAADGSTTMHDILERTMAEQHDMIAGTYTFGWGHEGQIDDWFTLLNLGFRHTALANSDTHGWASTEAGCPRNYIVSSTDSPAFIDSQEIADAVKEHRVVATYGPFVRLWVDGMGIGSEVVPEDGTVDLRIEVQAPSWIDVDTVEIYQNGTLIQVLEVEDTTDSVRIDQTLEIALTQDSWFVAIAVGDGDLAPVFTPVEVPYIPLDEVVLEALTAVPAVGSLLSQAVPIPRIYPMNPYGLTNPVWVDLAGDGFDAPGVPDWVEAPAEP